MSLDFQVQKGHHAKMCQQFGSLVFRNGISLSAIMKKLKNGYHFVNIDHTEKFQITDPPKVWVSGFPSVDGNGISLLAIMKKLKNGCHFINIDRTEKFQITDPPKVWVSGFLSVDRNGISLSAIKHSCVDIYAWFTSHLCVVLHFLIFEKYMYVAQDSVFDSQSVMLDNHQGK